MNSKYYKICVASLLSMGLLSLSGCCEAYTPLQDQAYIAQTGLKGNATQTVTVGLEEVTTSLNVRLSHPQSSDVVFECIADDSVLQEYNSENATALTALPASQYTIPTSEVTISKGSVVSSPLSVAIKAPTAEMKDSGKKYAIGFRLVKKSGDVTLLEGAQKIVVLVAQQAIQDVLQFSSRSNVQINFAKEQPLKEWTLEFMVNMNLLGKDFGALNNQTLFGIWGSNVEENGVKHSGEIYTRFGDAPIEGNRLQIKTKGTQMNSKMLFQENQWYHIAFVCSDTKLYLYVDGNLDNTLDLPAGDVWINTTGQLGNMDYLRATPQIAQLRLWTVARTQAQIKDNMANIDPKSEGLLGYWRFNEGKGDVFKDATGHNPDATVKNGGSAVWIKDVKLN